MATPNTILLDPDQQRPEPDVIGMLKNMSDDQAAIRAHLERIELVLSQFVTSPEVSSMENPQTVARSKVRQSTLICASKLAVGMAKMVGHEVLKRPSS